MTATDADVTAEVARLREALAVAEADRDTARRAGHESLEQQTATAEILRVISRSPTDVQPVFEVLLRTAVQLTGADDAAILQVNGDALDIVAAHGAFFTPVIGEHLPFSRGSTSGRAITERRAVHVPDLLAVMDTEYPDLKEMQQRLAHRTALAAPLLRGDTAIGALFVGRMQVQPFTEQQVSLFETFASQAVIAIANARLYGELQDRNRDLAVALERQMATAEILRLISDSPTEVQPVLDAVLRYALQFGDGSSGLLSL